MTALAWATPTRRAMRWRPLLAVATANAMVVLAFAAADAPPTSKHVVLLFAAMIVAGATLALDDPAHSLIAAAPVGFARRLAHRMAWLVPAAIGCLLFIGWFASRLGLGPISVQVLEWCAALGSTAVAANVLVARRRPDAAATAAAAAPAIWVLLLLSTSGTSPFARLFHTLLDQPWMVAAVGTVVAIVGARRN